MRLLVTFSLLSGLLLSAASAGQSCPNCCAGSRANISEVQVPGGAVVTNEGQPTPMQPPRGTRRSNPAQVIERLDTNGNGTLEVSELPNTGRGQELAAGDTNGDGTLSTEEIEALMRQQGLGGPPQDAPQGPQDGAQPRARRWGQGGQGFTAEAMITRLDTNGDGVLQISELPAGSRSQRLAAADADEDGVITPEEMTAHLEAMRAERAQWQEGQATSQPASSEPASGESASN